MKTINIFGRKISVVAVLIVALLVGTASAALLTNYATLSGIVEVPVEVSAVGVGDSDIIEITDGIGTFTITNTGDINQVSVDTLIYYSDSVRPDGTLLNPEVLTNTEGISISYTSSVNSAPMGVTDVISGVYDGDFTLATILVNIYDVTTGVNGVTTVTVNFDDSGISYGYYEVMVFVNPLNTETDMPA